MEYESCWKCPINRDCEEQELYDRGIVNCYLEKKPPHAKELRQYVDEKYRVPPPDPRDCPPPDEYDNHEYEPEEEVPF